MPPWKKKKSRSFTWCSFEADAQVATYIWSKLKTVSFQHTVYEVPLFSAGGRFSLDQTSWENCHGGIKRDNRKPVRGSTSGLSRFRAPHNIPRDGQQVGCSLQWSTFLVTCPLPGRKKKKERESKPIYNLSLSLPWWLDDGWLHLL